MVRYTRRFRAAGSWLSLLVVSWGASAQNAFKDDAFVRCSKADVRKVKGAIGSIEISGIRPEIIGGGEASSGEWPWAAAIAFLDEEKRLQHYCGGSLVAETWVLTAAHCKVQRGDWVILGREDLANGTSGRGEVLRILEVHKYPQYDPATGEFDAVLIRFSSPKCNYVPVSLDHSDAQSLAGRTGTVIGWGEDKRGRPSTKLLEVDLSIISNARCGRAYASVPLDITENMVCAWDPSGAKGVCNGDSGGPLMVQIDGTYRQVGIVGFGIECASTRYPGVYTLAAAIHQWVEELTSADSDHAVEGGVAGQAEGLSLP